MNLLHFKAKIEIYGVNPYVRVTAAQVALLHKDWHKPMPVLVQVNGQPKPAWSINMMPMGNGDFYLYLHGDVRKASHTQVGDGVEVEVRFDHSYQNGPQHPMPEWFQVSLAQNAVAQAAWDALIPSRQKEMLRYFASLKSDEARERNLQRALHVLSGHEAQFMGRPWKHGK